jgi:hypothetical protein
MVEKPKNYNELTYLTFKWNISMDYIKGIYELQHVDFLKNMNVKIIYH